MALAIELDSQYPDASQAHIHRLETENRGLRELLQISSIALDEREVPHARKPDAPQAAEEGPDAS